MDKDIVFIHLHSIIFNIKDIIEETKNRLIFVLGQFGFDRYLISAAKCVERIYNAVNIPRLGNISISCCSPVNTNCLHFV